MNNPQLVARLSGRPDDSETRMEWIFLQPSCTWSAG